PTELLSSARLELAEFRLGNRHTVTEECLHHVEVVHKRHRHVIRLSVDAEDHSLHRNPEVISLTRASDVLQQGCVPPVWRDRGGEPWVQSKYLMQFDFGRHDPGQVVLRTG